MKRDDFTCRYCGARPPDVELHIDHVVPVSRGGTNDYSNLITACKPCNASKSSQLLDKDSRILKDQRLNEAPSREPLIVIAHPEFLKIQEAVARAHEFSLWQSFDTEQVRIEEAAIANQIYEDWRESERLEESCQ